GSDDAELTTDAAVEVGDRAETHAASRLVELCPPQHEALVQRASQDSPKSLSDHAARRNRAQPVRRNPLGAGWVGMRHESCPGATLELRRKSGRERQDVAHDGVGPVLANDRPRLARSAHDCLVWLERPLPRGEDLVLGRGIEAHSLSLDVVRPFAPGLDRYVMTARPNSLAEGDRWKRVSR